MFKKIKDNLLKYFKFTKVKAQDPVEETFKIEVNEIIKPYKYPLSKEEKLKIKIQVIARRTKSTRIRRKNLKRLIDLIFLEQERLQNEQKVNYE